MARKPHSPEPLHVIEEFESAAERLADWVRRNAALTIGSVVLCLALVGGTAGYLSWQAEQEEEAANALAEVRSDYLVAMGAAPNATELPELANPETAERIREEYLERFREVAEAHPGKVAATMAWLQVGDILEAQGRHEELLDLWQGTLDGLGNTPRLRGIVQQRLAYAHEQAGDWAAAATAYEAAGNISAFPLRFWALADAARCFARAGQPVTALALLERVESEAPELRLPAHLRQLLRELRAVSSS